MQDRDTPPKFHHDNRPLQCLNCMSKEARRLKLSLLQRLIAPLVVPVLCNRCLTSYYYPRMLIIMERLSGHIHEH